MFKTTNDNSQNEMLCFFFLSPSLKWWLKHLTLPPYAAPDALPNTQLSSGCFILKALFWDCNYVTKVTSDFQTHTPSDFLLSPWQHSRLLWQTHGNYSQAFSVGTDKDWISACRRRRSLKLFTTDMTSTYCHANGDTLVFTAMLSKQGQRSGALFLWIELPEALRKKKICINQSKKKEENTIWTFFPQSCKTTHVGETESTSAW